MANLDCGSCDLLTGFTLACNEGVGGVKEIFVANWCNFQTGIVIGEDGTITGLPSGREIYRYQPNKNTGALTITPTPSLENGTLYYVQAVELTLGKLANDKKQELEKLSKAKVIVFVRLYDDQILCVGRTDGAFLTAGSYQSGKAKGDLNGYTLTLTAEEPGMPDFLEAYDPATENPFGNFAGINVVPSYA